MIRAVKACQAIALVALPMVCAAAVVRPSDYERGIAIDVSLQRPIVQLDVPDAVYQGVVTHDLSDVRVFNADGRPVPHALCASPTALPPTISHQSLPVFRLQDVPRTAGDGTRVEVQTRAGSQISVQEPNGSTPPPAAYVIDVRGIADELRAVQFDWRSPDGASETRVSIQASDDLDRWRTLVAGSTLLRAEAGARQLRRQRITIPQAHYQYLRVERVDRGPPLQIDGVIGERVTPAPQLEPAWFAATHDTTSDSTEFIFDSMRHAPFTYARLLLGQDNVSLHVAIDSRDDAKATWTTRWSGEVYSIGSDTQRRVSPPAKFPETPDRFWRVRLKNPDETLSPPPMLELGYRPARLRFLAQGAGPFTLAFGSRRAEPAKARACAALVAGLQSADLEQSIDEGLTGPTRTLGGEAALRPLPKPTPMRQIVLWAVLIAGVGALIAMALSLLRRVNHDANGSG